jgi:low affinity Fe/Cu permease
MESKPGWFVQFAHWVAHVTGRPITFVLAVAAIVMWGLLGPLFGFSDTWQLVINTATTIITFLMVFVIQNTQNRDTAGLHIKLDELIRVTEKARNVLLDLDHLDDQELERLKRDYERLAQEEIPRHLERRRAKSAEKSPPRKR